MLYERAIYRIIYEKNDDILRIYVNRRINATAQ